MADRGEGITIYFEGNTVNFDKSVDGVKKALTLLKAQTKAYKDEFKKTGDLTALAKKLNSLTQEQRVAADAVRLWADEVARLAKIGKNRSEEQDKEYKAALKQYARAKSQLTNIEMQMEKDLSLWDQMRDKVGQFADKIAEAGEKVTDIGDRIGGWGDKLTPMSNKATDLLKDSINYAIEYEDAFADVRKTVEATEEEYTAISDELKEMSKRLPASASELAKIAGLAGQMGVGADEIANFTEKMVEFGYSTNITAEDAAQEIAQIYNVIGKGGDFDSLDNLLSSIVALGNSTATTEADIVEMLRNIASAGTRVGMAEPQLAALAATLSSLGLDKGGASAVSTILQKIDMAVDTNADSLKDWADAAHMSVGNFKKIWQEDAAGAFITLLEGLQKTVDEGGSLNAEFDELNIKELRRIDTMGRLVNAVDVYNEAMKTSDEAYEEGNALSEEAAKRIATMKSQLQILKNNFVLFASTIGETLMPYLQQFVAKLLELANWLNNLSPAQKEMVVQLLAIVAALAPALKFIGGITKSIGGIMESAPKLLELMRSVVPLLQNIWKFASTLMHGVLGLISAHPIAAAITALVVALVWLWHNCEGFRNVVKSVLDWISKLWTKFKETDWIQELGDKLGALGAFFGAILESVKALIDGIVTLARKIKESKFGELVGKVGGFVGNAIGGLFSSGGFASGGMNNTISINNSFTITNGNSVDRTMVLGWADVMTERINENLGRMV